MATTSQTTPVDAPESPMHPGIFITTTPIAYLEPPAATIQAIQAQLKSLTVVIPQSLLRDLLTIKLLAPEESKDLVVYNIPMAAEFITKLKNDLVMKYYMGT